MALLLRVYLETGFILFAFCSFGCVLVFMALYIIFVAHALLATFDASCNTGYIVYLWLSLTLSFQMACVDNCFMKHWSSNIRIAERFSEIGMAYQKELMAKQQELEQQQRQQQYQQLQQQRQQLQQLQKAGFSPAAAQLPAAPQKPGWFSNVNKITWGNIAVLRQAENPTTVIVSGYELRI